MSRPCDKYVENINNDIAKLTEEHHVSDPVVIAKVNDFIWHHITEHDQRPKRLLKFFSDKHRFQELVDADGHKMTFLMEKGFDLDSQWSSGSDRLSSTPGSSPRGFVAPPGDGHRGTPIQAPFLDGPPVNAGTTNQTLVAPPGDGQGVQTLVAPPGDGQGDQTLGDDSTTPPPVIGGEDRETLGDDSTTPPPVRAVAVHQGNAAGLKLKNQQSKADIIQKCRSDCLQEDKQLLDGRLVLLAVQRAQTKRKIEGRVVEHNKRAATATAKSELRQFTEKATPEQLAALARKMNQQD